VCSILLGTGERDLANYLINALLSQRQTWSMSVNFGEYFELQRDQTSTLLLTDGIVCKCH